MSWHARLDLHYTINDAGGTTGQDRHEGPLRVLKRLYPEGPAICHHVLVHPPGGILSGDRLEVHAQLEGGSHALITTPGATRLYRRGEAQAGAGQLAEQQVLAQLAPGARLEWLPMETIAYPGCVADTALRFTLAPGAEMLGWDVLALGLPASDAPFASGTLTQSIELPGVWLERGRLDGSDAALLDAPLGLAGRRVLAVAWFAAGTPLADARREALLEAARALPPSQALPTSEAPVVAAATAPHPQVVVVRALADRVEPAMALVQAVWSAWRPLAWGLPAQAPRVWRT
jgi:urease accessory protein